MTKQLSFNLPMPRQEKAMGDIVNRTRIVRLPLTNEQLDLLISYAMRNGYVRKTPGVMWSINEQNSAAKFAILSRLGFE